MFYIEEKDDEMLKEMFGTLYAEDEMRKHRSKILDSLEEIVKPEYVREIGELIALGWNLNLSAAYRIVGDFNLQPKDLVALEGDVETFKKMANL